MGERVTVHHGDSREVLKTFADASIDSVVCDPPYALVSIGKRFGAENAAPAQFGKTGAYARASAGFMGQKWDTGETAFDPAFWVEVLRVLKPGGHLIAFSGTRTYHRLACAIEDAGFEMRDMIAWLYGSGFPKSHDVSKGIDKAADYRLQAAVRRAAVEAVQAAGLTLPGNSKHDWTVGDHAPGDKWWAEFQAWLPGLSDADRARVEGEIVQTIQKTAGWFTQGHIYSVRAPATEASAAWQGWGTALKPALEPIVLARKPLAGTVAANVLAHGTGALNIGACRVGSSTAQRPNGERSWEPAQQHCDLCAARAERSARPSIPETRASTATSGAAPNSSARAETPQPGIGKTATGCFDGTRADDTATSSNTGASGSKTTARSRPATRSITETKTGETTTPATCASCGAPITAPNTGNTTPASKSLKPDGSSNAPVGRDGEQSANRRYSEAGSTDFAATPSPRGGSPEGRWPANVIHDGSEEVVGAFPDTKSGEFLPHHKAAGKGQIGTFEIRDRTGEAHPTYGDAGSAARFFYSAKADADDRCGSKHPTVKPVDLMAYLVRLVTPPGGVTLDPFAGSGSTGMACLREGFDCILIEREAQYVADIHRRLAHVEGADTPLFANDPGLFDGEAA